ncbi:MAG: peroxiredoxin [Roseovarius sp.]|nr:peroxiredoxin [Roseovarius sp.]
MALRINDTIPNLTLETDQGTFALHDWIGDSWAILFSHPADFTPVCTTEFGAVAQLADEWEKRGTKVIGLSVDKVAEHVEWKSDIESYSGAKAGFPIIADDSLEVSKALDMLPADAYLPDGRTAADSAAVRVVFIISPDKKIQLTMSYPMSVGRNFAEVLRALDALQTTTKHNVATPADWTIGQDVIVPPSVSDDAAREKFGSFDAQLPYLRKVKLPG